MNTNEETVPTPEPVQSPSAVAEPMARQEVPGPKKAKRVPKVDPWKSWKLRCDSPWVALSAEQRETLEGWLFEENLGYTEVLERVQREFGIAATKMSISRYYQRLAAERSHRELLDLNSAVTEMRRIGVDREELSAAVMSLLAKRLLKLLLESPDRLKEIAWLGNVLVGNEGQEIKRGWLTLGREKFELDVARERAEEEAERKMMEEANADAENDYAEEDAQVLAIRRHLFGTNLPTDGDEEVPSPKANVPSEGGDGG